MNTKDPNLGGTWPAVRPDFVPGRRYVSLRMTIFLLVFSVVLCVLGDVIYWIRWRPCRDCRHPAHVEKRCGRAVPVEAGTAECVCERDR